MMHFLQLIIWLAGLISGYYQAISIMSRLLDTLEIDAAITDHLNPQSITFLFIRETTLTAS
jgi:hypothetical protein